MYLTLNTCTG